MFWVELADKNSGKTFVLHFNSSKTDTFISVKYFTFSYEHFVAI